MGLQNLTASGWVLLALTIANTLGFIVRVYHKEGNTYGIEGHALILGVMIAWLLWLVTP